MLSKEDPSVCGTFAGDFELKLNSTYEGEKLTLTISSKDAPPDGVFAPTLTENQIQALWIIAEGSVFPDVDGLPVWRIAKLLHRKISNVSRDVIKPFEKWGLICFVQRKSTREGTANPNQPEKACYIKRTGLRDVFNILFPIFNKRHFNNMIWGDLPQEIAYDKYIAGIRFTVLALLQKKLKEYESNRQYYDDLVGKFPDRCEVRP